MRNIDKKILAIFALALSLSVAVGSALAYFSDYEEASGGATLNLGGQTRLTEGENENEKDIVVTNTGKTDMIVRVGIFGPDEMQAPVMKGDWTLGGDGMYYYGKVLKPGEDTGEGNLVSSMKFSWDGEEPDYDFEVTVVHEGSQAVYEGEKLAVPDGWDAEAVAGIKTPAVQ